MAVGNRFVLVVLLISAMAAACYGAEKHRAFSELHNTLEVTASTQAGQVLEAGEGKITVTWRLNLSSKAGTTDSAYKTVKVKLCFAPESQVDRPWRKTVLDNIAKDKTCQFNMFTKPYTASNTSETYSIHKEIPSGTYFIRAYAYDSQGKEVAYGQITDAAKKTNIFKIVGFTGRTMSIDVASGVFSAFSILSLGYFFYMEKRKARRAA